MSSAPNLLKKTRGALARRLSPKWRVILSLPFLLLAPITRAGEPVSPTRELQKLIPADASVVLTVEDLRGQVRDLLASRLASDFLNLPAVKSWFDSEKYEQLETARDQIEGMLQAKLTEIRDQVLGDAVVIALRLPPDRPFDPGKAQGILVLKAGNPALLKRLIDLINTIQKQNGELATVVERVRGDVSYFVREFPAGSDRRAEAYVTFPDGTFAISNFGELITDLIDRKAAKHDAGSHGPASLADLPRFQSLDHKLPGRALARLYIDSRLAESLHKDSPQPKSPPEALIRRYVAALEAAGAALVVADQNIELNTAEVFEPHKFNGLFGSANVQSPSTPPRLDHVPATALAVGSLEVDFAALIPSSGATRTRGRAGAPCQYRDRTEGTLAGHGPAIPDLAQAGAAHPGVRGRSGRMETRTQGRSRRSSQLAVPDRASRGDAGRYAADFPLTQDTTTTHSCWCPGQCSEYRAGRGHIEW